MKLNLLPKTVDRGKKTRNAVIGGVLLAAAGIAGMIALTTISLANLTAARNAEADARPRAQRAVDTSAQADTIIASGRGIVTNSALASALIGHSAKYPALYDGILPNLPSFFRVTSITAAPQGADTATVTVQGVLDTYQQYADLMLACLAIPNVRAVAPGGPPATGAAGVAPIGAAGAAGVPVPATGDPALLVSQVGRQGFIDRSFIVPPVTATDQVGRPRPANAGPVPDNQLDRLAYFEAQAQPAAFQNVGNFGNPDVTLRGAGPDSSLITITMVVRANLQAPDVRATLAAGNTGGATTGTTPAGGATGGPAAGRGPAAGGGAGGGDDR